MRYFEVKVTGCYSCAFYREQTDSMVDRCIKVFLNQVTTFRQNKDQLTPSCPNWNETKEQK